MIHVLIAKTGGRVNLDVEIFESRESCLKIADDIQCLPCGDITK